ncbi:MAG: Rrf2 family transcriptional regulator [Chitinivibrionales bacterium]|nr:Rrf2 family transcriptional regulator [Chitinivibrionales bacterium]MBD3358443.1 Rrf2 family transcriptional regulator [Chitinivibrionales bacterium]
MFSISVKGRYGITAMIELARHHGHDPVRIRDIAERFQLPRNYLEQIFNRLGKQKLVQSVRGKNGGYTLAADPSRVTVMMILEALEGELSLAKAETDPALRILYGEVEGEVKKKLDISLEQMIELQEKHARRMMFHI